MIFGGEDWEGLGEALVGIVCFCCLAACLARRSLSICARSIVRVPVREEGIGVSLELRLAIRSGGMDIVALDVDRLVWRNEGFSECPVTLSA